MDVDKLLAAGNPIGGANLISAPPPTFGANMTQAGRGIRELLQVIKLLLMLIPKVLEQNLL
jgi:hypothetical protein